MSKRYTDSFKQKVLEDLETSGDKAKDVAKRHGISSVSIYAWSGRIKGKKGLLVKPKIHEDSQVQLLKEKLREALFAQYKSETGIDLNF